MLSALAAVALVVGIVGATVSVTHHDEQTEAQTPEPVVEVQPVHGDNSFIE